MPSCTNMHEPAREPQATRRPRLGETSVASVTRGVVRPLRAVERGRLTAKPGAGKRDSFLALLVVLLACAGCSASSEGGRFEVNRVEASWANGRLSVDYEQQLRLSPEARNALVHGVPLTVEVKLVLKNTTDRTGVGSNTKSYEIRYLPLSEHYQVSEAGENKVRTFPRLRHVLSELARLEISFDTGALPAGEYELLARCHLDRQRIPPPMRLPTLFSPNWDHDSSWTTWPLDIDPGA